MRLTRIAGVTARLLVTIITATVVLVGCSNQDDITGPQPARFDIFQDPLDGVLDATHGSTPPGTADRIEWLAEALGLTPEQKEALLVAYTEFREGMWELRDQLRAGEITREEAWAAMTLLRDDFEAALQTILTEEQWDLLQEMRAGYHHGDYHEGRDFGDRWQDWLTEIGASEGQIADVMAALQVMHDGFRDLRDQLLAGEITWEEARTAALALRDDFDAALQEILTPEQYEALLDLRPDCYRDHDGGYNDDHDGGWNDDGHHGGGHHH